MLEVFLKYPQTDNPMLPFLNDVLENLVRRLLRMFIKLKIVEDAVTAENLPEVDVQKKDNQISIERVCLFLIYSSIITSFVCTS